MEVYSRELLLADKSYNTGGILARYLRAFPNHPFYFYHYTMPTTSISTEISGNRRLNAKLPANA